MVETGSDSIKGIGYSIFLPTHRIIEFVKLLILPNLRSLMMTYFWVFLLMRSKELFNIDNLICAKFEIAYPRDLSFSA